MNHKQLDVWNHAIDFVELIYVITESFPRSESFGLVSQIRRAAVSISANLAEGAARRSKREFLQFTYIARGSSSELDTLLEISQRTRMAAPETLKQAQEQNIILARMLSALIRSLNKQLD